MALPTPSSLPDRPSVTPGATGLLVGLTLTAALLVASGSVETAAAGAVPLVALALVCAYAVDTALQWGRWLDEVTSDRPDTPIERLRSGRGRRTPLSAPGDGTDGAGSARRNAGRTETDPVARARERYVRGELDERGFERELEAALAAETDGPSAPGAATPADAADARTERGAER